MVFVFFFHDQSQRRLSHYELFGCFQFRRLVELFWFWSLLVYFCLLGLKLLAEDFVGIVLLELACHVFYRFSKVFLENWSFY